MSLTASIKMNFSLKYKFSWTEYVIYDGVHWKEKTHVLASRQLWICLGCQGVSSLQTTIKTTSAWSFWQIFAPLHTQERETSAHYKPRDPDDSSVNDPILKVTLSIF